MEHPRRRGYDKKMWAIITGAATILGIVGFTPALICNSFNNAFDRKIEDSFCASAKCNQHIDSIFKVRASKTDSILTHIAIIQDLTSTPEIKAKVKQIESAIYRPNYEE